LNHKPCASVWASLCLFHASFIFKKPFFGCGPKASWNLKQEVCSGVMRIHRSWWDFFEGSPPAVGPQGTCPSISIGWWSRHAVHWNLPGFHSDRISELISPVSCQICVKSISQDWLYFYRETYWYAWIFRLWGSFFLCIDRNQRQKLKQ
jgi:hypothetical protein